MLANVANFLVSAFILYIVFVLILSKLYIRQANKIADILCANAVPKKSEPTS